MEERRVPNEEELDELLGAMPEFDPAAVKRRTMERVAVPKRRRLPVLRGLLAAALVCAMSVSAMAVADMATNGHFTAALGLRAGKAVEKPEEKPEEPAAAEEYSTLAPAPVPTPAKEPEPVPEPPVMDAQVQDALALTSEQAERLRPAVQQINGAATDKEITMSVLQMLGDRHNAWIKIRFDFPQDLPVGGRMKFRETNLGLDSYSWDWEELERTERSATYLLKVFSYDDLMGKEIALTVQDYGYEVNRNTEGFTVGLKADRVSLAKVDPQGNLIIEDENITAPEDLPWKDGYARVEQEDGGLWLYYDGSRGKQTLLFSGGQLSTTDGQYPRFEVVVEGTWSHTWALTYEDLSLGWTGEAVILDPAVTVKSLRLGSLSWEMTLEGDAYGLLKNRDMPAAELVYADGTTEELLLDGRAVSYDTVGEEGWCVITRMGDFETPLDLSRVTAIWMGGQEFPLD